MNPELSQPDAPSPARRRLVWEIVALALLPLVWATAFYYLPVVQGGLSQLPVSIDGGFYTYQLTRAGEVDGRWWQLADDDRIGQPYRSSAAKHPGVYEGVDLLLVSAVTSRFLPPVANYHLMIVLVLLFNGWVAAWIVRYQTGSFTWAALATLLITANGSLALNMSVGHLHLIKFGWTLLAAWAYVRYLDQPTGWRGVVLGLAVALVLGTSFYFGYFLVLALGIWWLAALVRGRLDRRHFRAAGLAAVACLIASVALTFPVWTVSTRDPLAGEYFHRDAREVWVYGAELYQYLVSPFSKYSDQAMHEMPHIWETWHYPGCVVVLALVAYLIARLRGFRAGGTEPALVDSLVGLLGLLALISLRGGPGTLLFPVISTFRCYGRAGILVVGLGCVAAPIILWGLGRQYLGQRGRQGLLLAVLVVALYEGNRCRPMFNCYEPATPAWVTWLAEQPEDVRLAALAPRYTGAGEPGQYANLTYVLLPSPWKESWQWLGLYYCTLHHHATLNGCEFALFENDLRRVGATYDHMTPDGLRLLVANGYNRLAFQQKYLDANAWIRQSPDFELVEVRDDWSIYRPRSSSSSPSEQEKRLARTRNAQ